MPHLAALLFASLLSASAFAAQDSALFSADGYRLGHYRSPTPARAEHAQTLDTEGVRQLLAREPRTVLIDVYRRQWLHGRFIEDEAHANLPGSLWLANTGDGELDAAWQRYFSDNLARVSHGDPAWPLLFYCRSDCWLGWNAQKRAYALGYRNLYWYRDGIDAWQQAGLPLQAAEPAAFP
jgi:PQQ-dependent catabolism-associated CXXCW motif protein